MKPHTSKPSTGAKPTAPKTTAAAETAEAAETTAARIAGAADIRKIPLLRVTDPVPGAARGPSAPQHFSQQYT